MPYADGMDAFTGMCRLRDVAVVQSGSRASAPAFPNITTSFKTCRGRIFSRRRACIVRTIIWAKTKVHSRVRLCSDHWHTRH